MIMVVVMVIGIGIVMAGTLVLPYGDIANIGSGNGLVPDGTKPLPETMLTHHERYSVAFNLWHFHKKFSWTSYVTCVHELHI